MRCCLWRSRDERRAKILIIAIEEQLAWKG